MYLGPETGVTLESAWLAEGNQSGSLFGYAVAAAGDVNGDHIDDVIVTVDHHDNGQENEGRAYLYVGASRHAIEAKNAHPGSPLVWCRQSGIASPGS